MKSIKLIFPLILLSIVSLGLLAQEKDEKEKVYYEVDEMPQYPGGLEALKTFISSNIMYPQEAKKNGISGKVYVNFTIDKNGKVTDAKITKGVENSLDKEALRVVELMPAWKPGKKDGHLVKVGFTLPINFEVN